MTTRWGILSTGRIAHTFAAAIKQARNAELIAVASRSTTSASTFARDYGNIRTHDSVASLVEDENVDAVYVASPHPAHASATIEALKAGKHVLCEKPLGLNHAQVMSMIESARRNERFLMEGFMYRLHPQTQALRRLIEQGAIGAVRHIDAQFGFQAPFDASSRLFSSRLGGGGIMDVGCYCLSMVRMLMGEPDGLHAHGRIGESHVDEWSTALLTFEDGRTATVSAAVSLNLSNTVSIYGSAGRMVLENPWIVLDRNAQTWQLSYTNAEGRQSVEGPMGDVYATQIEHVQTCIEQGLTESPEVSWQDSLCNALALDRWRESMGLTFEVELPASHYGPLAPLEKPSAPTIPQSRLGWSAKPVSSLVMGCDNQPSLSHAAAMWDHFFELGGNCFDTAWVYGSGAMEVLMGHWHHARNIREDIVLIGKGAHTPHCTPEAISRQLDESLERLQTDYLDLYFMHRDDIDVPVGEFVDALEAEVSKGRIRAYGGSNWTLERVKAANAYAAAEGAQGFSAVSNNFSLAYMEAPVWPGVVSASDQAYRDYLQDSQITLMPWSSQARGFFTEWGEGIISNTQRQRAAVTSMQPDAEELRRVWFSERNFKRRERAAVIAKRLGADLINVALAYVLHQPFPTLPIVGPRLIDETNSCCHAASLMLSANDLRFLEDEG